MRIPRLTRSTRSFLREVVIDVLGVLIALASIWRDRQRTRAIEF